MSFGSGMEIIGQTIGNTTLLTILGLVIFIGVLFFIRASKEVIIGLLLMLCYFLADAGIIPTWIFGMLLILAGLYVGSFIIRAFFRGGQ